MLLSNKLKLNLWFRSVYELTYIKLHVNINQIIIFNINKLYIQHLNNNKQTLYSDPIIYWYRTCFKYLTFSGSASLDLMFDILRLSSHIRESSLSREWDDASSLDSSFTFLCDVGVVRWRNYKYKILLPNKVATGFWEFFSRFFYNTSRILKVHVLGSIFSLKLSLN